jgi:hypothetical protein
VTKRLKGLGIVLVFIGFAFVAAGAFAFIKTQEGYKSLNAFSAAQNVQLSYENGQLGGGDEETVAIMSLLKNDWGYPVVDGDLNPNDPTVNTATEYMFQMATVAYHTLTATTTVVLTEPAEFNGETIAAGEYEFVNDGRYWTGFNRENPIEGAARAQIWTPTAHALIGELGVGTATASALQLALALAGLVAGLGATLILTGGGLVWATRPETVSVPVPVLQPAVTPA